MKKFFIFKISIIVFLLCSISITFIACDGSHTPNHLPQYIKDGNYIYFGQYPQTIKSDDVMVSTTANSDGYYLGSDGETYAKVVASPYKMEYTFSNEIEIDYGTTYYFKVEPIRWRILEEIDGKAFILCDVIIDNHCFDDSSNNYKNSDIRAWLNGQFYNTAFTELQQDIIRTTTVDNSVEDEGYNHNLNPCEDTRDKIYLLSPNEVVNGDYGLGAYTDRDTLTSDYCRAKGVYMCTCTDYYGNGYWWLRTPYYCPNLAHYVYYDGSVGFCYVNGAYYGVVPALWITL